MMGLSKKQLGGVAVVSAVVAIVVVMVARPKPAPSKAGS